MNKQNDEAEPALGTDTKDLSQAVRFHRKKSGLSQVNLAKLAGVGKTVIFDIEKGKQTIQMDTLLKVLHILNISILLQSPLMATYLRNQHEKRKRLRSE